MTRQEWLDKYWNRCTSCEIPFKKNDLVITFGRQKILSAAGTGFADSVITVGDSSLHDTLVEKVHYHQNCFLEMAGDNMDFWNFE